MCGAMSSLTPCIAPKVSRDCDLDASMSFNDVNDMIQKLNAILAVPKDFRRFLLQGVIAISSMPSQQSDTGKW